MTSTEANELEIRTLGRFQVKRAGLELQDDAWPRRKTQDLLKVLITAAGRLLTVDQLIEVLLPGADPRRARSNIRARVSELRSVLEPDLPRGMDSQYIKRRGEGYLLCLSSDCWLDIAAFEDGLTKARRQADNKHWTEAVRDFEGTLNLYQGEFLAEDRYEEWAEGTRSRVRQQYLEGTADLASCFAELGRLRQAISCCQRILGIEPFRESVVRQLMTYQNLAGHRTQALTTFTACVRALAENLDAPPSSETCALYDMIRRESDGPAEFDPRRIAVLPLENYGAAEEDEYIADGLTEELIGCIAKVKDLRVIARSSVMRFKHTQQSATQIAHILNVGTILEGSTRRFGDRVHMNVQLIDATTEEHLWTEEYERPVEQLLVAQCDVARQVASALAVALSPQEETDLMSPTPLDPEVCSLLLKARHFSEKVVPWEIKKAVRCLDKALVRDPDCAAAHAGLSLCYSMYSESLFTPSIAYQRAKEEVDRALRNDSTSPDTQIALGMVQLLFERDSFSAGQSFRQAIGANPSHAPAHLWQGYRAHWMSSFEEALHEFRLALELDPLSPFIYFMMARSLVCLERYNEAFEALESSLEIEPSYLPSLGRVSQFRWYLRDWEGAMRGIARLDLHGHRTRATKDRMMLALYHGDISQALALAQDLRQMVSYGPGEELLANIYIQQVLLNARQYEAVIDLKADFLRVNPDCLGCLDACTVLFHGAIAHEMLGQYQQAMRTLSLAEKCKHGELQAEWRATLWVRVAKAMVRASMGDKEALILCLAELALEASAREAASAQAVLAFRLGHMDRGFGFLYRALDHHDWFLMTLKTHPWFDPARKDPRFADIQEQMGPPA